MKIHRTTICAATLGMMAVGISVPTGGCSSNSNSNTDAGSGSTSTGSSSGTSSGSTSTGTSSGSSSATSGVDAGADASSEDAGTDASSGDAGCTTLNVYNFKNWCSGTINGTIDLVDAGLGATSLTTACLPPGDVSLVTSPFSSGFVLGPDPWISISAIDGGGSAPMSGTISSDGGTSTATVTLGTAPGCVLLCCPFAESTNHPDAGPDAMVGCNPSQSGFEGDGGPDSGFTSLCP